MRPAHNIRESFEGRRTCQAGEEARRAGLSCRRSEGAWSACSSLASPFRLVGAVQYSWGSSWEPLKKKKKSFLALINYNNPLLRRSGKEERESPIPPSAFQQLAPTPHPRFPPFSPPPSPSPRPLQGLRPEPRQEEGGQGLTQVGPSWQHFGQRGTWGSARQHPLNKGARFPQGSGDSTGLARALLLP